MNRFGPNPRDFFEEIYQGTPPWDVGQTQPALLALFDEFPPEGPVLDVGCGSGDLAIALAERGYDVLGLDFADAAIAQAERKAAQRPEPRGRLEFRVGDGLRIGAPGPRFGAVVDSGFFHLFDQPTRDAFAGELGRALRAGGRYYLLAFATEFPMPNTPLKVTEQEIRDRFTDDAGWRIAALSAAEFTSRIHPVPAVAAVVDRL